jgi:ribosomal-protein-alanine N-acetyltransferase
MSVLERLIGRDRDTDRLEIVAMRKRDVRAGVLDIEAQCYPRPWSQSVFTSEVEQARTGSRHYVVARKDKRIAGYAGLWFTADEAHVTNVAVDPTLRRQGIARQLMLVLAAQAIERGCVAWTLEVRISATGAQDLYRQFGFEAAGVRQRYYENVEDAIVMWCHHIQSPEYRRRLERIREGAGTESR